MKDKRGWITVTLSPNGEVGAFARKNGRELKFGRVCSRVLRVEFDDKTRTSPFVLAPIVVGMLNAIPHRESLYQAIFVKGMQYLVQVRVRGGRDYSDLHVRLTLITPDEMYVVRSNRPLIRYERVPDMYRNLLRHKGVSAVR